MVDIGGGVDGIFDELFGHIKGKDVAGDIHDNSWGTNGVAPSYSLVPFLYGFNDSSHNLCFPVFHLIILRVPCTHTLVDSSSCDNTS